MRKNRRFLAPLQVNKKGIYFSMDAVLSGLLLVGVAVALLQLNFYEPKIEQESFLTQDVLNVLGELRIDEIEDPFVQNEIIAGNIENLNNSIIEQAGEYWALNETAKAIHLLEILLNDTLPEQISINLSIGGETLFLRNQSTPSTLVPARRMISGIAKGKPIAGFSSSAYLKKIRNKKTSSYAYFGGYYGQGNITSSISLPDDFAVQRLLSAQLKMETGGTFDFYINGVQCGGSYTGTNQNVTQWDVANCNGSFVAGQNNITFNYTSTLNTSAMSGGFLKITYTTDTLKGVEQEGYKRHQLPGIKGFINMYDAFSAQGLIRNWTLNMTFYNEYDTFVTLANETILIAPGDNVTQNIVYTRLNTTLPPTQIPLRIGTTNLSNITVVDQGEPADSFLVTDVSGSMGDCGEYFDQDVLYCGYEYFWWMWWIGTECPYPGSCSSNECGGTSNTRNHAVYNKTFTTCNRTLMDLAKAADHLFVDVVLGNSTLNRIGLVDYSSNANPQTALTNVEGVLHSEIDTYTDGGATCTCCGINRAKDSLLSSPNEKFMIVLSDGEPTRGCSGFSDYTGSDEGGASNRADAIASGQEACANNITVYTIGFGEGMSSTGHDVMRQTACNASLYFNATNVSQLAEIYENISNQILVAANYSSQTINIVGNYSTGTLSPDSYLDMYYEPILSNNTQSRISLVFESEQFGSCDHSVLIPDGIVVEDAHVTSFSSNHWTKSLLVNDVEVFNLTTYGTDYTLLGDPFIIQIPSSVLIPGQLNNFSLEVGDNPTNNSACSPNNTLIYTALINASTPRTSTYEDYEGCNWTIESEAGTNSTLLIPVDYAGANNCTYTNSSMNYNSNDAYDMATYHLLEQLDPDGNGRILVDIAESDLEITITLVSGVPYLWGPSIVDVHVWT